MVLSEILTSWLVVRFFFREHFDHIEGSFQGAFNGRCLQSGCMRVSSASFVFRTNVRIWPAPRQSHEQPTLLVNSCQL
jgi:hypothetical protein